MASEPREIWGDLATTAFVESSHLFKSLDPEARRDLLQVAQVVTYGAGETISPESDEAFYLVCDGSAALLASSGAGLVEVAHLERGAFFGEGRVLALGGRAALSAVTEVTAVAFPVPVLAAIAERFPKVHKLLAAVHAAREKDLAHKPAP